MAGIVWWEVATPDPEEFQRFHEAMWGWEFHPAFVEAEVTEYWVMVSDGRGIGGLQRGSRARPRYGAAARNFLSHYELTGPNPTHLTRRGRRQSAGFSADNTILL